MRYAHASGPGPRGRPACGWCPAPPASSPLLFVAAQPLEGPRRCRPLGPRRSAPQTTPPQQPPHLPPPSLELGRRLPLGIPICQGPSRILNTPGGRGSLYQCRFPEIPIPHASPDETYWRNARLLRCRRPSSYSGLRWQAPVPLRHRRQTSRRPPPPDPGPRRLRPPHPLQWETGGQPTPRWPVAPLVSVESPLGG